MLYPIINVWASGVGMLNRVILFEISNCYLIYLRLSQEPNDNSRNPSLNLNIPSSGPLVCITKFAVDSASGAVMGSVFGLGKPATVSNLLFLNLKILSLLDLIENLLLQVRVCWEGKASKVRLKMRPPLLRFVDLFFG